MVYYNEHDPFAAAWLRELIREGVIADGDVDERDIEEVRARDLAGYSQHHFFAGIGGWSYALRLAGWPDDRAIWTGSCPCQPYSAAGRGKGNADPRNLWPYWRRLIRLARPDVVVGEQVAQAIGHGWLDTVSADLEAEGYAIGACVLGAHSIGAPHLRQRLYFIAEQLANRDGERREGEYALLRPEAHRRGAQAVPEVARRRESRQLAKSASEQFDGRGHAGRGRRQLADDGGLGRADTARSQGRRERGDGARERAAGAAGVANRERERKREPWRDVEWLPCKDGRLRPTQPDFQFMVNGIFSNLGDLWHACQKAIAEEINGASSVTCQIETLQTMWHCLAAEAIQRHLGRSDSLSPEEILLFALCEHARGMGSKFDRAAPNLREIQEATLRIVRGQAGELTAPARPSPQWRLARSSAQQLANALREVSPAWRALTSFPLAVGMPNRVGTLRGAGNAIVPQLAAAFIEAYLAVSD